MAEIQGYCDERFAPVRAAFEENFQSRKEVGASVALSVEGEMVVDLSVARKWLFLAGRRIFIEIMICAMPQENTSSLDKFFNKLFTLHTVSASSLTW